MNHRKALHSQQQHSSRRPVKPQRPYWAGKAPDVVVENYSASDEEDEDASIKVEAEDGSLVQQITTTQVDKSNSIVPPPVPIADDRQAKRLARLQQAAGAKPVAPRQPSSAPPARIHQSQEPMHQAKVKQASDSEDEYTDEEEEAPPPPALLYKPVFKSKSQRISATDNAAPSARALSAGSKSSVAMERVAEEERRQLERKRKLDEARKAESLQMAADAIERERLQEQLEKEATRHDVDDTDDLDVEAEVDAWRERELYRLRRNRQERHQQRLEQAELERRRGMTNDEIMAEDADQPASNKRSRESKIGFMQKFYHKGAFVLSEEVEAALSQRDFALPTGEDRFDKSALPKVMQVKRFGFAGQSKYTHLKDQDTTDFSSGRDFAWKQKHSSATRASSPR